MARIEITDTWQQIVVGQAVVTATVIDGPVQYADTAGAPETNTVIQNVTTDPDLEVSLGCWMRCPIPGVTAVVDIEIADWPGLAVTTPDGSVPRMVLIEQEDYDAIPIPDAGTLYLIPEDV